MIKREQVILPLRVYNIEHYVSLEIAQSLDSKLHLFLFVLFIDLRPDDFASLFRSHLSEIQLFSIRIKSEVQPKLLLQSSNVPLIRTLLLRHVLVDQALEDVLGDAYDVHALIFALLFRCIALKAEQQISPKAINLLALFVHYVVVLEQMFAD